MTQNIAYRPVQVNDLPWLADLYAGMVTEVRAEYPQQDDPAAQWLAWALRDDPTKWTGEVAVIGWDADGFGRATGGTPVGVIFGIMEERPLGTPRLIGNADWLYVRPDYRGKGISRNVIHNSTVTAMGRGIRHIEVTTSPGSHAEATWQALGFVPFMTRWHLPVEHIIRLYRTEASHD